MNKETYDKLAKLLTAVIMLGVLVAVVGLFFVILNSFGLAAAILIIAMTVVFITFIFMVYLVKASPFK